MYTTRPLRTGRPVAEYRQTIKGGLKYWRKAAMLSQATAAKLAGVARSTWQRWEDPARDALPDVAALAAVADGCPHRAGGGFRMAGHRPGGRGADRFRLRRRAEDRGERFLRAKKDKKCLLPHPLPVYTGVWSMRTARKGAGA